ncbi:MAG TPA: adenylate/guanylate cyclase domain-containing protein [Gaiellaceae bacterium]|nr:adenylate/guanylate cyclase domain-containing protein [Gaiellaceae bacterium]
MTLAPEVKHVGAERLMPYVPRVVVEWLREEPDATWRSLEGTLAFADLSGFTAMSERLARKGKAGAEEVTDVINATFGRLLQVAYENGGGVLKFNGDALLLFFSGDEHAQRAARASYGMRRALREIGRPRTSAGVVTLRMHVGLNTGTFRFFLVGGSHRELLLCGPEVAQTVAMEEGAEAGEILVTGATTAALPARSLGAQKAGGRLLKADVPVTTAGLATLPDAEGLPLADCVPLAIRNYLAESPGIEPEHRQATVAFLRFAGTEALLADDGSAGTADALDQIVRTVQRAADEHRVCFLETDVDPDGVRIILVAGAPQTAGDDEERMLRTVRSIADARLRLPLHAGVHRGRVFAGEVGASYRRTYTIMGETAAVAARLMAKAEAGAVLATTEVLERSRTPFETVEQKPFAAKGKKAPLVSHDVRGVAGGRETAVETATPFVGRERELAVLGASLTPVRMGFGSLVELIGDPGMGKSRLVQELLSQWTDLETLRVSCEEYKLSTPYFPFRGLLRSLLDVPLDCDPRSVRVRLRARIEPVAEDVVRWIPLLALPLDVDIESTSEVDDLQPAFRRARLHGVVESLLAKLLPDPTVLVIEDVHWMDEPSCHLLRHLAGQVTAKPWLICGTRRPTTTGFIAAEGTPPVAALTIHLEPLPFEAARALVDATRTNGLRPDEIAAIAERSGGNPLFLHELVASAERETEAELPESVEAVVTTRIDKLAPAERTLLRYAAVMGSTFSAELVGRVLAADDPSVSPDSESWDRLAEFVERDPYTAGGFRFRHALFRDAAYEGLSYRRRRELHASVGGAYESLHAGELAEHAELLSLHFFHADDHLKAYDYSLLAGDRAREKYANVEAAVFYRRGLAAAKHLSGVDPSAVAAVWEALGDVSEVAGLYAEAADAYRQARQLTGASGEQPALLHKEGLIRERSSQYPQALRWYRRALAAVEAIDEAGKPSSLALEIRLSYAGVRFRQGRFADCIEWCNSVVEEALEIDDLRALAHGYYLLHLAYTSSGNPNRVAFRGMALPVYEELGDLLGQANVLNNLGIDAYYEGRWDEALDLYARSQAAFGRIGDVVGAATIANNIGEIKSDQGHYEVAEALFTESREVCARAGSRFLAALAESNLGRLAARVGRFDEADTLLRNALAEFQDLNARSFILETSARIVEKDVLAGEAAGALRAADEALQAIDDGSGTGVSALIHRLRGYALMQSGDLDDAAAALEDSLRSARAAIGPDADGESYEVALTLEAVTRLAELRGVEDNGAGEQSEAIFRRLGVSSRPVAPLA